MGDTWTHDHSTLGYSPFNTCSLKVGENEPRGDEYVFVSVFDVVPTASQQMEMIPWARAGSTGSTAALCTIITHNVQVSKPITSLL